MCGIGAVAHKSDNISSILYEILFNLQHRGQDSSGLVTYDFKTRMIYELKEFGLVDKHIKQLSELSGTMGIGHVRYPTQGLITKNEIQPFYITDFDGISLAHNGNLTNLDELKRFFKLSDISFISTSDSEIMLKLFAYFLGEKIKDINELTNAIIFSVVKKIYDICKGSYSIVIMINNYGLIAFRDIHGIRPLVYCTQKDYISIASETTAFPNNNNYCNIKNGEVIVIKDMNIETKQIYNSPLVPCLFEYIYLARPESYINDILVYEFREKLAHKLLNMFSDSIIEAIDCVIPVPETGIISAIALAENIKKPLKHAIIKNRYTHRTFINPDKNTIVKNIKKIKVIKKLVEDKNVLIIDDSIVRGNTSKYILNELRKCGAKKIFLVSCCPPIRNPNIYGIAIPSYEELIAHNKTEKEIEIELNVDKLFYLDLDSLCNTLSELNSNLKHFETSVFTGNYIKELAQLEI